GASGHSKVIIEILERSGSIIKGLFDDDPTKKILFEYVVSDRKSFLDLPGLNWIVGIGNNETRKKIVENNLLNYETIIDLCANVSKRSKLGKGTVIMPGVTVNSSVIIGNHGIINTNASVDHDCVLEDYVHISPNATLCGCVKIGEGTHIGAGAVIIPGIRIGKWAKIGAGSVIIKDVPDHVTIAGNPGKLIKLHNKQ
ncbi:MAG: acetyltransferase, partial [Ginsengibacter sp.]